MLAALVLAGIIAAPVGTLALLVKSSRRARTRAPGRRCGGSRRRSAARWCWPPSSSARCGCLGLPSTWIVGAAAMAAASLAWLPVTRRWNARGHLCWSTTIFLFVVYLAFVLDWTLASHLGPAGTAGGLLLWLFELFAAILACAYLWEICDALGSETGAGGSTGPSAPRPRTPTCRSSACTSRPITSRPTWSWTRSGRCSGWTIRGTRSWSSTTTPTTRSCGGRCATWCARHGAKFAHLEDWPGYKSGALNYALREMTDPRAEIIGVVDSDYQLDPGFLRRCAPLFADSWVGFTQAPQDYRGWERSRYYRRLFYSYLLFRGLAAVTERAGRGDLRRHHGPDPPGRARAARRLGRVVHHRGRRAVAAAAAGRLVRAARGPVLGPGASCR